MSVERNPGHEADTPLKVYRAPELTVLGPIQTVVLSSAGAGCDMNDVCDVTHS